MTSSLGTLPTPFAYNADCSTQMQNAYYVDLDYLLQGPPLALPRCMPDNYGPWADWFYSASSCPPGYTSACQSTQVVATLTDTYVTWCPSVGSTHFSCQTTFKWKHQSTLGCASELPATYWTLSPMIEEWSGTTSVTVGYNTYGAVNAYSVQIRYGAADLYPCFNRITDPFPDIEHNTHIQVVLFGLERRCSGWDRGWMYSGVSFNSRRCGGPLPPRRWQQRQPLEQTPVQEQPKVGAFPVEESASPSTVPDSIHRYSVQPWHEMDNMRHAATELPGEFTNVR
ncbi:hypothetical protein PG984_013026 [Apiospora sp. TS-2023a]